MKYICIKTIGGYNAGEVYYNKYKSNYIQKFFNNKKNFIPLKEYRKMKLQKILSSQGVI